MRDIKLALIITTYHRKKSINNNLHKLLASDFFYQRRNGYYGGLHIFVVDNASELVLEDHSLLHLFHNKNTGGSGGFQRGIEEVRKQQSDMKFTHVIFMDDDVEFQMESFYLLYDFLKHVEEESAGRPVAGRMFDLANPSIQWTAAERWNAGQPEHVEFLRDIRKEPMKPGRVIYDMAADYGGFWFCCYPVKYVMENDILPFFIHCDDVEYGLRCGEKPIIIEGVQVWHETWDKKISPIMRYYDFRNGHFVNQIYGFLPDRNEVYQQWKKEITDYHVQQDYQSEYMIILAMNDFLKGLSFLYRIDPERYHRRLQHKRAHRIKNALLWRLVAIRLFFWSSI